MNRDPILASKRLPAGTDGYRVPLTLTVYGGLHYMRGNSAPYFTLTCWSHRVGFPHQCESGGADHRRILAHFPRFADLAALHMADIDGVPMHAEANGWYWLAGAMGGADERYHGGNSDRQHWLPDGTFNGYRHSTPDECLATFAEHVRVSVDEARGIRGQIMAAAERPDPGLRYEYRDWPHARTVWRALMEAMRPRWADEAAACIAAHKLRVYGDPWTPEVPASVPA